MILNHFRAWALTASPAGRAEGARALARAYLFSNLDDDKRRDALRVLTGFLDDPSPLVRRALAEVFADEARAPHHIILGLADDQAAIAAIVLHRSPLLSDAELIDCAIAAESAAQVAIASRPSLSRRVAAALAQAGSAEALTVLARNPGAALDAASLTCMIARHGGEAELREALLARPDLPAGAHVDLVTATTAALAAFVGERNWMSTERMKRVTHETRDKAAIVIVEAGRGGTMGDLVAHLRRTGQLTVGFALRAILSGKIDLFEATLAELADAPSQRVAGIVARCGSTGFASLYRKAGLPMDLLPAFRIALRASREDDPKPVRGGALSSALVDRVLTACAAINSGDLDQLLVLLRRFESEAAREDARLAPTAPLVLKDIAPLVLDATVGAPIQVTRNSLPDGMGSRNLVSRDAVAGQWVPPPLANRPPIFVPRTKLPKASELPEQTRRPRVQREPRDFVIDLAAIERELCAA